LPDKFFNYYFKFIPGEALSSDLYLKSCHCSSVWGVLFFIVSSHSGIYISFFPPESVWTITWINFIHTYFAYSSWNITLHIGGASAVYGCVVVCVCVFVCMCVCWDILEDSRTRIQMWDCWMSRSASYATWFVKLLYLLLKTLTSDFCSLKGAHVCWCC
jgi:ABC-type spermidine/putrescine transport system permease subunit I